MLHRSIRPIRIAAALLAFLPTPSRADEQLFGWVTGAETLPGGHFELYQFSTLRTGKPSGPYYGYDFETELEYGFTDKFQASVAVVNRYFDYDTEDLGNRQVYRFGGIEVAGKYRVLSPFKDFIGLALRLEGGFLIHDDVGGFIEHEPFIAPGFALQKNFLDDTLIVALSGGVEWAWGKQPAEEYPREFSYSGGLGVSYRFARNWFIGAEAHARVEYPLFDLNFFEHGVVYAGPTLHYGGEKFWATLSWNYQVYGEGVDESHTGQTFAEEQRNQFRLKVGINF